MERRTAFIGREREIAEVRSLLEGTRLLTLTGPGGIGKTRLATEAIDVTAPVGPRRVMVELASVRDPDQLLPAIGAALGVRESSAIDALHVVTEHLERAETILLLDNFEQIVSAGPTVGSLLDAAPSTRVAVTSRVPLHISGEQEYAVPPLSTPPAAAAASYEEIRTSESVRLFLERARAVRPTFELTAENAAAVGEICRRLDGVPLAIELAASRLKLLSPDAMLKRLGQQLDFLTGGAADAPARQRTLRATIAWSYGLLPASERALLARSAVFTGGFALDGARAVEPDQDDRGLLEALGLLVDHNLLTAGIGADQEPRFGMLETIREFGQGELSSSDGKRVRDRHADFCIQLAELAAARLQGFEHTRWLARLHEEIDNIRAARAWLSDRKDAERLSRLAAAMGTYFRYYGSLAEGRAWLAEALGYRQEVGPPTRAAVLMHAGWLDAVDGDLAGGKELLQQALAIYDEIGDEIRAADTRYHLGATLTDLGDADAARAELQSGLAVAKSANLPALEGRLLYALAFLVGYTEFTSFDERERMLKESIAASTRAGDRQRVALTINHHGWVAWDRGDRQVAVERWDEAVAMTREWGEGAFLGSLLMVRSFGERMTGRMEDARQTMLEGLRLIRETGALPDIIGCLADVVLWLHTAGAAERAQVHWQAAERLARDHGFRAEQSWPLPYVRIELGGGNAPAAALDRAGVPPVVVEEALDAAEHDLETAVIAPGASPRDRSPFELTPREREVLGLVVAGRTNAEIGEALFISRKTASVHVANIKDKLAADSRIGIVTIALERGLVASHAAEPSS